MKKELLICAAATLLLLFSGCTKFESIFDGSDADAIAPIVQSDLIWPEGQEYYGQKLLESILRENGMPNIGRANNPLEYAIVINDPSMLEDMVYDDGTVVKWPEIDLSNHSLIVGCFYTAETGYFVADQRIKKKLNGVRLYLEIQSCGFHLCSPITNYFAAVYPKISGGPVEIIRWDNYQD